MTSDFRPDVEIWPFRACAMHYIPYLWTDRAEIGVVECKGDVRLLTGCRNMAVLRMSSER